MTKKQRDITNTLIKASEAYYYSGKPIMDDAEFDSLMAELQKLEEESGEVLSGSAPWICSSRLSNTVTSYPFFISFRAICEPINPAPPVISTLIIILNIRDSCTFNFFYYV